MIGHIRKALWAGRNWYRGDYAGGRFTWGQFGEDILIWKALETCKGFSEQDVTYLDLGANHPSLLSNTMFAYQRGGNGVLVEPNPTLAAHLKRKRPRDHVLAVGTGATSSKAINFHEFDPHVLSTFCDESAVGFQEMGHKLVRTSPVEIIGINELLQEHFHDRTPDFISIDVEGLDTEIVSAIDWQRYPISVVCVETWDMVNHTEAFEIERILAENAYTIFAKAGPNTIFRKVA